MDPQKNDHRTPQGTPNNQQPVQPQKKLNPGLSEREIAEILASSGVNNGQVVNGVKLATAIADIIVTNNDLLMRAVLNRTITTQQPYEDVNQRHQTNQPTQMWEAGAAPQSGYPAPDTTTNHSSTPST